MSNAKRGGFQKNANLDDVIFNNPSFFCDVRAPRLNSVADHEGYELLVVDLAILVSVNLG